MSDDPFPIAGALDLPRADELEPHLLAYAEELASDVVPVDCSAMTFIDSSGIGMLLEVGERVGKHLVLQDVPPKCRHVFKVAGLESAFLMT